MTQHNPLNMAVVVLAAGSSSRMGQSKQLLTYENKTLLRRTLETALAVNADHVICVLGSRAQDHHKTFKELPVIAIENTHWQNGMGSSLKFGIKFIQTNYSNISVAMILVCDQPKLRADHLQTLIAEFKKGDYDIVASYYKNKPGVPVLFSSKLFPLLLTIDDNSGAKKIIQQHQHKQLIPFPEGEFDVDTPEDFEKLLD